MVSLSHKQQKNESSEMTMNVHTGRTCPEPMPGLSKRAQELLKPRKNQIIITPKSQTARTQQLSKTRI